MLGSDHHTIAPLIRKYLQKSISKEEMAALQLWIDAGDDHKQLLTDLEQNGYAQEEIEFLAGIDVNRAWQRTQQKKERSTAARMWKRWFAVAAAVGLLLLSLQLWNIPVTSDAEVPALALEHEEDMLPGGKKAELVLSDGTTLDLSRHFDQLREKDGTEIRDKKGVLDYSKQNATTKVPLYNTLKVPKTGMYELTLPDGTHVWINAMSTLKFPVQFVGTERKVYLEGEAYFDVAKDEKKPFIVSVNGTDIRVLGTQFNVNSYNASTTTTLVQGSVKVLSGAHTEIIKPGEEARATDKAILIRAANMAKALAWKQGDFYFERDNIMEIMQQLQRWYDFELEYKGEKPGMLFSGNITRSSKLSEVLEMLTFVSDNATQFKVQHKKVEVSFNAR